MYKFRTVMRYFQSVKVLLCVPLFTSLLCWLHFGQKACGGGRQHITCEKCLDILIISLHSTLSIQMLGEQFTPRHTSQRKWCSCSGVKVSLPSWPPSSRSPPRRESYSPSTSQNTGNPSIILFMLACSSVSAQLYFRGLLSTLVLN